MPLPFLTSSYRIYRRSHAQRNSDAGCELHHSAVMDSEAIRRGALITLQRAICERFQPGRERRAWLRCAAKAYERPRQAPRLPRADSATVPLSSPVKY